MCTQCWCKYLISAGMMSWICDCVGECQRDNLSRCEGDHDQLNWRILSQNRGKDINKYQMTILHCVPRSGWPRRRHLMRIHQTRTATFTSRSSMTTSSIGQRGRTSSLPTCSRWVALTAWDCSIFWQQRKVTNRQFIQTFPQIPFLKTWISLGHNGTDTVSEKEVID